MFNPNQHDVRRFFCVTYRKNAMHEIFTPLESIASYWITQHPEYVSVLSDLDSALNVDYSIDQGKTNPFLHLSMHLSITEQTSIDQPPGIEAAFINLAHRLQSVHEAHHVIMKYLGTMLWESQRNNTPFDGMAYVNLVQQYARQ